MEEHKITSEKAKKVLEVAKYIIENIATIEQTAKYFNMSPSSIKKYINNDLKMLDEQVYNNVKMVQGDLISIGRLVGAMNGKREPKYTDFEMMEVAETMIEECMTIEEASARFNIPTSTIYERITDIKDERISAGLSELFESNMNRFGGTKR
ncbi:MAG TPA: sporulation transcriptional regulator SpoIIID [Bacilli bacterium]|nr:sporulation transcriptional regulator SpoIIID [Bacilli bacterium]